jgi:SET domain-containing protein
MLTVKTILKETEGKGIGLFAAENLPAGTIWWKDDRTFNRIVSEEELNAYPKIAQDFVTTYGFMLMGTKNWYVCMDNARFTNHSISPNSAQTDDGDYFATREIQIGEEITCDYREFCGNGLTFDNNE